MRGQVALARALWSAPADRGRDRSRARTLLHAAREALADAPERAREVEALTP
jgi:hypothetical protein